MANIVNQDYWNKQYKDVLFQKLDDNHYLSPFIEQFIPFNEHGKAIEIGCYPCRYLSFIGNKGYEINGIDLNPDTPQLFEIIKEAGYRVGKVITQDFTKINEKEKYDIVCSFGFVEHFTNLDEIILKHANIVAPNGYLIIETPNFNGWGQYLFHYLFDTPNLRRHVKKNMDPFLWVDILKKNTLDFEILCCQYCGGIDFWTDKDQSKIQNFFAKIIKRIWWAIKFIFPFIHFPQINNKTFSRSCILIAKRNSNE